MAKMHPSIAALATAGLMTLSSTFAFAQTAANTAAAGIAKIVAGDVRVVDAQGEHALKSGDAVFENTRLIAGKQGTASVVLRDGTTLVMSENSQFEISKFTFDATTQDGSILVNLLQGSMRMLTGLIAKINPEAIQVKTKTLSVGIRGTDFIVNTEDKP
jgi:hypothetical protein